MIEQRIKLAEAMECERQDYPMDRSQPYFRRPNGEVFPLSDFNPFTDANDCDALKQFMQSQGWAIDIDWQHLNENAHSDSYCPAPAIYVEIWHCGTEQHERYDTDRGEPYTVAATVCKCLGIPLPVPDTDT